MTRDNSDEYGVSQIFIAIEVDRLIDGPTRDAKLQRIMDFITTAERADENVAIRLPGHEFTRLLEENRSNGITGVPLMALIAATLFNVAGNVFFVLTTDWGAAGVALATVLSNLLAAGILFFRQLRTTGILQLVPSRLFAIDRDALRAMVRIGLPAGIPGMVFSLSNILVQSAINSLGPAAMAGSVAGMTIEINVYCFINGFGLAATTFISQNYGARNFARCRRATWVSFWLNLAVTAVMVSIVILFARDLLRIFSDEEAVIALGVARIWYVVLPEFISVVMETTSDAMRGYGYSLAPAMVTLVAICSVRVIWVLTVFPANPTFERLMTVYPVSWAVTAVLLVLLYMRHQRSLRAKEARLLEAAAARFRPDCGAAAPANPKVL